MRPAKAGMEITSFTHRRNTGSAIPNVAKRSRKWIAPVVKRKPRSWSVTTKSATPEGGRSVKELRRIVCDVVFKVGLQGFSRV
jgi:hypothetical protein